MTMPTFDPVAMRNAAIARANKLAANSNFYIDGFDGHKLGNLVQAIFEGISEQLQQAYTAGQQAPSAAPEGWVAIHLKTGNEYMVTGESIHAGNVPAVPGETMVEYQRDGKKYVRAAGEFQEKFAAAPKERK